MSTPDTFVGPRAVPFVPFALFMILLGCGASCGGTNADGASSAQRPVAKPADAPATVPEPPTEEDIIRALVATVTPAQRAEYEARDAKVEAQYDDYRRKPKYETLFEVPVLRQDALCDGGPCMRERALYYGHSPEWGLGRIAIDRGGNIWIDDSASSRVLQLYKSGRLLSVRLDHGEGVGLPPDGWSDLSQLTPVYRTQWQGKRYVIVCDPEPKRPSTIVIGDKAYPFYCTRLRHVGSGGDFYAGNGHYDAEARLLGYAMSPEHERDVLIDGDNAALGPDGKLYAYIARKNSVRFVEVPFYPQ